MYKYEVTVGIRQDYRVVLRNIVVENHHPMSDAEIKSAALAKIHVHVRYLAKVTGISRSNADTINKHHH